MIVALVDTASRIEADDKQMRQIYLCHKRQFADLDSASHYAARLYATRGIYVKVQSRRVRANQGE